MKILVTNPMGRVSSEVIRELKQRGVEVYAAMCEMDPPENKELAKTLGVPLVPFNFADPDCMAGAMQGFERVFLSIPLSKDLRKHGAGAVAAAKAAGVGLVVRCSIMGADPNAHFQLGKVHGAIDADLEASGVPFVVLRPATFMQDYVQLHAEAVRAEGKLLLPERESRTSFVDLRDVASAAASVLADPAPETDVFYVVTGPQALSNHEVAAIIAEASGREVVYESCEVEDYGMAMERAGIPEWNIHMMLSVHRYARSDYTSFKTKAVEHLSGKPANDFKQFAAEFADVWK